MKRTMVVLFGMVALSAVPLCAQEYNGSEVHLTDKRLAQTEASLVMALESTSPGLQTTAAQTVRELKALKPDYSFSSLIIPLMRIVKAENAQVESRILAALALHELNSDRGDFAIKSVSIVSDSKRFRAICNSLTIDRVKQEQLARNGGQPMESRPIATAR